jgi:hypothetical protein
MILQNVRNIWQHTTFFLDRLALKALQSFKMWGTTDPTAQLDILRDFTL